MQTTQEPLPTRAATTWAVTEHAADGHVLAQEQLSHREFVAMVSTAVYGFQRPAAFRPPVETTTATPITARRVVSLTA